jgi:NAD-specific glutamate dehydrogenase
MALRRNLVLRALESADGRPVEAALAGFLEGHAEAYDRLGRLVSSLDAQNESSLAALTVALRQVRSLVS